MPNDPVYFTVWRDLKGRLGNMRRAEGYHLDYGEVVAGGRVHGINDSDYARPKIGLRWLGELSEDPITGGDRAAHTTRRHAQYEITIPAKKQSGPNDSTERAYQILADVHAALMGPTSTESSSEVRTRGLNSAATWESNVLWLDRDEFDVPIGGTLAIVFTVRLNHQTGDLSAVR